MAGEREVIALAGVGCLGQYVCEELLASQRYDVLILSRKGNASSHHREVETRITDYSEDSVLEILDSASCSALISFVACPDDAYVGIHRAFLHACIRSKQCKRLIPSEWIGNSEGFPLLPRAYGKEREIFRELLRNSSGIQWTLFNGGWLMDYFLPEEKTYMYAVPNKIPVDPKNWRACIRGSGNERQTWTWSRDIAKAVVALLSAPEWDRTTYVAGEWGTFNGVVELFESKEGRPMPKTYKSKEEIMKFLSNADSKGEYTSAVEVAELDEWMITGASACPREKTLLQREKFFKGLKFWTLKELLKEAEKVDFI